MYKLKQPAKKLQFQNASCFTLCLALEGCWEPVLPAEGTGAPQFPAPLRSPGPGAEFEAVMCEQESCGQALNLPS